MGEEQVASARLASLPGCLANIRILPWLPPRSCEPAVLALACAESGIVNGSGGVSSCPG